MDPSQAAAWMLAMLRRDGCVYQEDVVDMLIRVGVTSVLKENADGNDVLAKPVLDAFRGLTINSVVWVRADRYWRWRVAEDEIGRDARG